MAPTSTGLRDAPPSGGATSSSASRPAGRRPTSPRPRPTPAPAYTSTAGPTSPSPAGAWSTPSSPTSASTCSTCASGRDPIGPRPASRLQAPPLAPRPGPSRRAAPPPPAPACATPTPFSIPPGIACSASAKTTAARSARRRQPHPQPGQPAPVPAPHPQPQNAIVAIDLAPPEAPGPRRRAAGARLRERLLRLAPPQPGRPVPGLADLEPPQHALGRLRAVDGPPHPGGRRPGRPARRRRAPGIDLPARVGTGRAPLLRLRPQRVVEPLPPRHRRP